MNGWKPSAAAAAASGAQARIKWLTRLLFDGVPLPAGPAPAGPALASAPGGGGASGGTGAAAAAGGGGGSGGGGGVGGEASSVVLCKRLLLLKPVLHELAWRGPGLQRQLLHDLEALVPAASRLPSSPRTPNCNVLGYENGYGNTDQN